MATLTCSPTEEQHQFVAKFYGAAICEAKKRWRRLQRFGHPCDIQDLIQEASIALLKAASTFRPGAGCNGLSCSIKLIRQR
jgi:hypothetical protein